jgi:hypothetical protein
MLFCTATAHASACAAFITAISVVPDHALKSPARMRCSG